jgi:SAM-dependent methyltransferase
MPALLPAVRARRSGSFRALLASPAQRAAFFDVFLVDIFALVPSRELHRLIASAAWDARNAGDAAIYAALRAALAERTSPLSALSALWAGVRQASEQKRELVREVVSVLARLGKVGAVHAYVSIGDAGKLVLPLRAALAMRGAAWVVHDSDAGPEDVAAVVERGAHERASLGTFVRIDYADVGALAGARRALAPIPDGAADLVTLCQGLHHFVPAQLPALLAEVRRVLRVGGVFLLREHALDEDGALVPMLDCAHAVFNAVTGVAPEIEAQELRCFRPLAHWRAIVEAAGLADAQVCEMQPHDPTRDVMLAYVKPPPAGDVAAAAAAASAAVAPPPQPPPPALPPIAAALATVLNSVPGAAADAGTRSLDAALRALPRLRAAVLAAVASLPDAPGVRAAATLLVERYLDPAVKMLSRFQPLTAAMTVVPAFGDELVPPELLLLGPALRARARAGPISQQPRRRGGGRWVGRGGRKRLRRRRWWGRGRSQPLQLLLRVLLLLRGCRPKRMKKRPEVCVYYCSTY